jgi:DamX protein
MTSSASGYPLITRERTEKLELLKRLVSNLAHSIIVCGPEGVGKTYLLKNFQERIMETWMFCWVNGDSQLTYEKIQQLIGETLAKNMPDLKLKSQGNVFDRMESWNTRIILVVDDAGSLPPGLIEKIISYASDKAVLRIIFALTHNEYYLKIGTDPSIEDCYQIEIPPFSETQCREFLEHLSTLAQPQIQFSAINENLIATLYRETHGIPGNIIAKLPKPDNLKGKDYSKAIYAVAVIGLIGVAMGVQWWSSRQKPATEKAVVTQVKPQIPINPIPEKPSVQVPQKPAESLYKAQSTGIRNDVISGSIREVMIDQDIRHNDTALSSPVPATPQETPVQTEKNEPTQTTQAVAASTLPVPVNVPIALDEGGHWLVGQPGENVTLQLMALPNEQAIVDVMQRHQALGQNLKYLKTKTRSDKVRFVLLYGSFASPEQAKNDAALLPKELQKYWLRKISAIQGEIDTNIQTDLPE